MKLNRLTGACLTAGLLLYSASAQADRRTSLAGNDLIQDADDAFLFPQDVHLYKARLTVDLGMAEGLGGGFFTMGDDNMTFGVAIHRGPQEQMIVGWGNRNRERDGQSGFGLALPDEAGIGGAPIERFDGFFGMKLSEQLSLGLRLGIGQGLVWARNEVPDGDNVDTLDDSNSQERLQHPTRCDLPQRLSAPRQRSAYRAGERNDRRRQHHQLSGLGSKLRALVARLLQPR